MKSKTLERALKRSCSQEACYLSSFKCLTAAGRPQSSAPWNSDLDDSEADELGSEEESDLKVHGFQGCGSRWRLRRFATLATSLESVHL